MTTHHRYFPKPVQAELPLCSAHPPISAKRSYRAHSTLGPHWETLQTWVQPHGFKIPEVNQGFPHPQRNSVLLSQKQVPSAARLDNVSAICDIMKGRAAREKLEKPSRVSIPEERVLKAALH